MKGRNLSAARRAGLAAAAAVLAAVAGAGTPAAASTGGAGHRCASQTAYVVNAVSYTVTPISTRTDTAGPAIPVGHVDLTPGSIAIMPGPHDR